ncbi:BrnT family toxin [Peteryoungia ipomoeae]|uniref:BrnT family toxin n=1 Tax=Peteryoungia ipomoeae TaxID=1210932 RepID=A0A4S8P5G6_9HYPH|nr:BrnT family toxin [Peteryoungia ipomoeae]THV22969.1 BrnT family toxin [Peteryoungia ipomoeae]
MKITCDPAKRLTTPRERGLDFLRAGEVFDTPHLTIEDNRRDYGEVRFITIGYIDGRMVVLVWTHRADTIRIISMRKANEREQSHYSQRLTGH